MSRKKLPILFAALLLKASGSLAQSQPAPEPKPTREPDYQQVSIPVPRAVSLVTDVFRVLLSRNPDEDKVQAIVERRRARAEKREQSIDITVPKNKLTRTLGLVD